MIEQIKALIEDFSWDKLINMITEVVKKVFAFVAEEEGLNKAE